jgi:hypothetical protein
MLIKAELGLSPGLRRNNNKSTGDKRDKLYFTNLNCLIANFILPMITRIYHTYCYTRLPIVVIQVVADGNFVTN